MSPTAFCSQGSSGARGTCVGTDAPAGAPRHRAGRSWPGPTGRARRASPGRGAAAGGGPCSAGRARRARRDARPDLDGDLTGDLVGQLPRLRLVPAPDRRHDDDAGELRKLSLGGRVHGRTRGDQTAHPPPADVRPAGPAARAGASAVPSARRVPAGTSQSFEMPSRTAVGPASSSRPPPVGPTMSTPTMPTPRAPASSRLTVGRLVPNRSAISGWVASCR